MPKTKVLARDAKAVSARLKDFARRQDGSMNKFRDRLDIPRTTWNAWVEKDPSVPEASYLLRLARDANMNLNWLLLGEGQELRERETTSGKEQLVAAVEAELRASEEATVEESEQVWQGLLSSYKSMDADGESNAVIRPAVEAARPLYRQLLWQGRGYVANIWDRVPWIIQADWESRSKSKRGPAGSRRRKKKR